LARKLLHGCVLLDPEADGPAGGSLLLEDGRIAARLRPGGRGPEDAERVDLSGLALAPGFLDLHLHGRCVFAPPHELGEALRCDASACVRQGTTAFLATTVASPADELAQRVATLAEAIGRSAAPAARPLGLHLEGPWIAAAAAGAQPCAGIRPFDAAEADDLLGRAAGLVRMVTLAPEVPGAPDLLDRLAARGVVAALGHSRASSEQAEAAIARGARHVTHLFNAMAPLHHREPGLVGVALADDRLTCDAILDGVHLDPRIVRVIARVKGERLVLISDRLDPPAGAADFGSGPLREDRGALRLPDGRLAGSTLTLDRAIRLAQRSGAMTRFEAIAACTLRPARVLGVEAQCGTLRPGARADFALLDAADRVVQTWIGGERAYAAPRPGA
jgi:N-acetylglucosamine-6-phosphate deacetylase